jgi:hypothetical protein
MPSDDKPSVGWDADLGRPLDADEVDRIFETYVRATPDRFRAFYTRIWHYRFTGEALTPAKLAIVLAAQPDSQDGLEPALLDLSSPIRFSLERRTLVATVLAVADDLSGLIESEREAGRLSPDAFDFARTRIRQLDDAADSLLTMGWDHYLATAIEESRTYVEAMTPFLEGKRQPVASLSQIEARVREHRERAVAAEALRGSVVVQSLIEWAEGLETFREGE